MIEINCYICEREIWGFGALLFSPPEFEAVKKFHICNECQGKLMDRIESNEI